MRFFGKKTTSSYQDLSKNIPISMEYICPDYVFDKKKDHLLHRTMYQQAFVVHWIHNWMNWCKLHFLGDEETNKSRHSVVEREISNCSLGMQLSSKGAADTSHSPVSGKNV